MSAAGAPGAGDPAATATTAAAASPVGHLNRVGAEVRDAYVRNRTILSFAEYFALATANPAGYARSAAQYLRDAFDYYGTTTVASPRGSEVRYRLFDCPFDGGRGRLIGQEEAQGRVYRAISNFVRDGRASKLILLHGPNGSAKSTFVACLARALEHYSTLDEGTLYRFNWIFPSQRQGKGGIGFGGERGVEASESFAHLDDALVDARLPCSLRDNPILLIPPRARAELLRAVPGFTPSELLLRGDLSPRNRQIFDALLAAYGGDYLAVLRHVQVERFYLSRRYRSGLVTVEPQLAVDARTQQQTMDRSLQSLPPALQSLSLYEISGDLAAGNRGLIEYADLLKRPLEAYKYLLGTVEHGHVTVDHLILHLDTVFIGSSNESHLAAFKEAPDFQSFKGRIELVRMPYLLDYRVEADVYRDELLDAAGRHVAPHAIDFAAQWAVLTRVRRPIAERYRDKEVMARLVSNLTPLGKADLYATGRPPRDLPVDQARELVAAAPRLWSESEIYPNYEGRSGASPREVKTLLLNAAQSTTHACVTPLAVAAEIEELIRSPSVYEFLRQEAMQGGYHDQPRLLQLALERWLDQVDDEVRESMGLVDEQQYTEQFTRYITHVSHWVKKEKLINPVTGRTEEPDAELMAEIERTLGATSSRVAEEGRRNVIAKIGAWSIEHPDRAPDQRPDYGEVFRRELQLLREAYFVQHKALVQRTARDLLVLLTDGATAGSLDTDARARVHQTAATLKSRFGYCDLCAREAVSQLVRVRYP